MIRPKGHKKRTVQKACNLMTPKGHHKRTVNKACNLTRPKGHKKRTAKKACNLMRPTGRKKLNGKKRHTFGRWVPPRKKIPMPRSDAFRPVCFYGCVLTCDFCGMCFVMLFLECFLTRDFVLLHFYLRFCGCVLTCDLLNSADAFGFDLRVCPRLNRLVLSLRPYHKPLK